MKPRNTPGRKLIRRLRAQRGVIVGTECRDIRFRGGREARLARVRFYEKAQS